MTAPTVAEIRMWAQGLGLPVKHVGNLPEPLLDRWDREHPDRIAPRNNPKNPPPSIYSERWRRTP